MNKLKVFISAFFIAITAIAAAAQADDDMAALMGRLNKDCPVNLGGGLTVDSFILDDNGNVVEVYIIDEDKVMYESLEMQADMFHDVFAAELISSPDADLKDLRAKLLASGKSMIYRFTGSNTGKSFDIVLTAKDLR